MWAPHVSTTCDGALVDARPTSVTLAVAQCSLHDAPARGCAESFLAGHKSSSRCEDGLVLGIGLVLDHLFRVSGFSMLGFGILGFICGHLRFCSTSGFRESKLGMWG